MLKVVQQRTQRRHPRLISNKWQGFIANRWPSSACSEPFLFKHISRDFSRCSGPSSSAPADEHWPEQKQGGMAAALFARWGRCCICRPCTSAASPAQSEFTLGCTHRSWVPDCPAHEPAGAHYQLASPFLSLWASSQKQAGCTCISVQRWSWVRAKTRT